MSGLGLIPNEIAGYRLKPDWHSWNVVLVKRHGPLSKHPGQEYETTLAYCKHLTAAVQWMFMHALRTQAERNQADEAAVSGSLASAQAVVQAVQPALDSALKAIGELQAALDAAGVLNKDVIRQLGAPAEDSQAT